MNHAVFGDQVRVGRTVVINKTPHVVSGLEIWDPSATTCWFGDGSVLFVDHVHGVYLFGKEARVPFSDPFPQEIFFQGKTFRFVREGAHVLKEAFGQGIAQEGAQNQISIYQNEARHGLYLQRFQDGSIRDLSGEQISEDWVELL